ncbi:MAG: TolC family protein [Verrucomicrobia bacterium]|nr:TolC family protein [Verrucomicrobiota bacterium]
MRLPASSRLLRLSLCLGLFPVLPVFSHAETVAAPAIKKKLGLEEAIRLALEKSFIIKVSAFEPAIARAGLTEAWGRYDPRITGSYQETRDEEPKLTDPFTGLRPSAAFTKTNDASLGLEGQLPLGTNYYFGASTTNYRGTFNNHADTYTTFAGVTVTQPLLRDFGLNPGLYQIRIARTNLAISEWDYRQTVTNLITQVIYAYSDLHLAQAYLSSTRRSRDMAVQLYNENEGRRKRGAMSEYDVLSARARVANREDYVLKAELGVRVAENALKQLITDERNAEFFVWHLAIEVLPPATSDAIDAAAGFRSALTQRPDYRRACLNVEKSGLDRRYQRNQLLPRVDLNGSYGYNGIGSDFANSRTDTRSQNFVSSSAGVSVNVPIASATERGRARAAKLRLRQAETNLQRLEQDILVDVNNAAQQVESTRQRVATTKIARELNEEMLESELKRLRAGTGSTFSVLYQQEELSGAEIAAAQAMADHSKAIAEYDRQIGHTLDTHHIALRAD